MITSLAYRIIFGAFLAMSAYAGHSATSPRKSLSHPLASKATRPVAPERLRSPYEIRKRCLDALNRIHTLKASFTETDEKRRFVKSGTLALKRPQPDQISFGSMRVTYTHPPVLDIITQGRNLIVRNKESGTQERLPITSTPLSIILRKKLTLGNFVQEKSLKSTNSEVLWTLTEPHQHHGGAVTLIFDKRSFALLGWNIHDVYGNIIKVKLSKVRINEPLPPNLFVLTRGNA